MESLPPELARLAEQREAIVQQYQNGLLDQDAAMASLDALSAIDGSGAVWKLNLGSEGGLFVRGEPGGPLTPCEPVYFAPFTRPADPGSGPFPESTLPAFTTQPGSLPAPPSWVPDSPVGLSTGSYSGAFTGGDGAPVPAAKRGRRLPSLPSLPSVRLPGLGALSPRAKQLGIVVVLVLIIGGFLAWRSGSSDTATPSGLPTPSASGDAKPSPSSDDSTGGNGGQVTEQPTAADVTRVLSTLASGNREQIATIVAAKPAAGAMRGAAVRFAGFDKVGIIVDAAPAAPGKNGITQVWTFRDPWQTEPVGTVTVTWKRVEGTWLLATLPQ